MKMLTSDDYSFRKTVEECNGVGLRISKKLGISPQAVSARLNSAKHLYWWKQYKRDKNRAPHSSTVEAEKKMTTESAEEVINKTNLKLRELVVRHRGNLSLVAKELGIPKGVDFVEEYLNSEKNYAWWALCRFNPENDFKKREEQEAKAAQEAQEAQRSLLLQEQDAPTADKNEIALLREQISALQDEMAKYKQVISLYETAHKMVSTQTHT